MTDNEVGALVIGWWTVTFWYNYEATIEREGGHQLRPLFVVPNVTAHPSIRCGAQIATWS